MDTGFVNGIRRNVPAAILLAVNNCGFVTKLSVVSYQLSELGNNDSG